VLTPERANREETSAKFDRGMFSMIKGERRKTGKRKKDILPFYNRPHRQGPRNSNLGKGSRSLREVVAQKAKHHERTRSSTPRQRPKHRPFPRSKIYIQIRKKKRLKA